MVSSEKRARRGAHGHARADARVCARPDTSRVAENSATRRKTRLRSRDRRDFIRKIIRRARVFRGGGGGGRAFESDKTLTTIYHAREALILLEMLRERCWEVAGRRIRVKTALRREARRRSGRD